MLRYLTAGESHGELLMGILEGMPSGLLIRITDIDHELARRQGGYGRGGRMKIEKDTVKIYTGVRWGKTLGSPIGLMVRNKDWENWRAKMSADPDVPELRRGRDPAPARPCGPGRRLEV